MCMGCACVSTRFTGCAAEELMQNGVNGILVPCDDVITLANTLNRILTDEKIRVKLRSNAELLRDKVNVQHIDERWLEFLCL